jgi:peptidylprolyl isomerase
MAQAKQGDKVKVHYTGSLADGQVFDSSVEREPFEFVIGKGMVIPGFENGIIGMKEGETKNISIPAENGYGPYRNDLVGIVDRSKLPPQIDLKVGMMLQLRAPDGNAMSVMIKEIVEDRVTLDLNHPLAGKDLIFEVKALEISAEGN